MKIPLDNLVSALRAELIAYGEMLARLDEQQQQIAGRNAQEVLSSVSRIEEHTPTLTACRELRLKAVTELKLYLELPGSASVQDLLARVPSDYRGLLKALLDENTELAIRIQQRSRQNHILLLRSVECMQRLLHSLLPSRQPTRYKDGGTLENIGEANLLCNALG